MRDVPTRVCASAADGGRTLGVRCGCERFSGRIMDQCHRLGRGCDEYGSKLSLCVGSGDSLSVVSAVMTRLVFPRPLDGSSRITSTEKLLAEKSARGWGCHVGPARAGGILAVNQGPAALVLYAQHTASQQENVPSTTSERKGEHLF